MSGDHIEVENSDQNLTWGFNWSDASGGKLSVHMRSGGSGGGGNRMVTGSFTRLD